MDTFEIENKHTTEFFTDDFMLCPELDNPQNGQVVSDGVTAMYTCQETYMLEGESQRDCDGDSGEWLGEEPTCSGG